MEMEVEQTFKDELKQCNVQIAQLRLMNCELRLKLAQAQYTLLPHMMREADEEYGKLKQELSAAEEAAKA